MNAPRRPQRSHHVHALLLMGACVLACSAGSVSPADTASQAATPDRSTLPSLTHQPHWVLVPDQIVPDFDELEPSGVRRLMWNGVRVLDLPDGRVEMAAQDLPTGSVETLRLPARFPSRYLFSAGDATSTSLWVADDWTAPARALSRFDENVQRIIPGFDRLYVQLLHSNEIVAIDPTNGRSTDKGSLPPSHGYGTLEFVDEWFAAVQVDVRGVLATFDAGDTWHALRLDGRIDRDDASGNILLGTTDRTLVLDRSGELESFSAADATELFGALNVQTSIAPKPESDESKSARGLLQPLGPRPLVEAVLHGWPLEGGEVIVASNGALGRVRSTDGLLLSHRSNAYPGTAACPAVRLGTGVGFVCNEPGRGTQIYAFEAPLGMRVVASFATPRKVAHSANGLLVVRGTCRDEPGPKGEQPYCVVGERGPVREVRVQGDVGVERVVALRDGRAVVLIPPRPGAKGKLHLIGARSEEVPLTLPRGEADWMAAALWADGVTQIADDELGTWVTGEAGYFGVEIGLDGRVKLASEAMRERGDPARTIFAGPFGFEVTAAGVGWQTSDYGMHWEKILLPRQLEPLGVGRGLTLGEQPRTGCSPVGCAYPPWLLVGYRAPDTPIEQSEVQTEVAIPDPVRITPPSYENWDLDCYATGAEEPIPGAARGTLLAADERPARAGLKLGYGKPQFPSSEPAQITDGAYRPFWGVRGPRPRGADLLFDFGVETPVDFRAYAYGSAGAAWPRTSAWVVRVAARFDSAPALWTTLPTHTPWTEVESAARVFGSDRLHRYSPNWSLVLDADETSGVLRTNVSNLVELHLLSEGKAITSLSAPSVDRVKSAARVRGSLYFGAHEGSRATIHSVQSGQLTLHSNFPVGLGARASVIRSSDEQRLGVLVQSGRGDWYVYPLDDSFIPSTPIVFTREQLARTPGACEDDVEGWLVRAPLPLTRIVPPSRQASLKLAPPQERWQTSNVDAKVILNEGELCVAGLAAELITDRSAGKIAPAEQIPDDARIPLTAWDATKSRRVSFLCSR